MFYLFFRIWGFQDFLSFFIFRKNWYFKYFQYFHIFTLSNKKKNICVYYNFVKLYCRRYGDFNQLFHYACSVHCFFLNSALFLLISRVTCTALINHIIIYISDLYHLFDHVCSALFLSISRVVCTAYIKNARNTQYFLIIESYASHTSHIHYYVSCAETCTSYKYVLHAAWQIHFIVQKTTLSVNQYEDIIYQYLCIFLL